MSRVNGQSNTLLTLPIGRCCSQMIRRHSNIAWINVQAEGWEAARESYDRLFELGQPQLEDLRGCV